MALQRAWTLALLGATAGYFGGVVDSVVMRLVDDYWIVVPGVPGAHGFHWLYVVTPVALGGLWLAAFARQLRGVALVPGNEPLVEQAMAHGH